MDNRQQNHEWGPWMWTATGSYAEPLQSDEQPESWHAFTPDLHTARLTANRMREMNCKRSGTALLRDVLAQVCGPKRKLHVLHS